MYTNDAILTRNHPSSFRNLRYVYPVLSRRAGGISIGINLSLTSQCNFRCVYCQVKPPCDSTKGHHSNGIDLSILEKELSSAVELIRPGAIFEDEWFSKTSPERRVLRDFAFSGDGEPTLSPLFPKAVQIAANVRRSLELNSVKLILITNATRLQEASVVAALDELFKNHGEVWTKLDAGTAAYYHRINRSKVPFEMVLENIASVAKQRLVTIQTMLLRMNDSLADQTELDQYCRRLNEIQHQKGTIDRVQLYTVARPPLEEGILPLTHDELDERAALIRARTGLITEQYYSG